MRCRFCKERLVYRYSDQEWVHELTDDIQGPDGHYAEARSLSGRYWALTITVGVLMILAVAVMAVQCVGDVLSRL